MRRFVLWVLVLAVASLTTACDERAAPAQAQREAAPRAAADTPRPEAEAAADVVEPATQPKPAAPDLREAPSPAGPPPAAEAAAQPGDSSNADAPAPAERPRRAPRVTERCKRWPPPMRGVGARRVETWDGMTRTQVARCLGEPSQESPPTHWRYARRGGDCYFRELLLVHFEDQRVSRVEQRNEVTSAHCEDAIGPPAGL